MTQEEKYDESDAKQAAKGTPEWTEVIQNRQKRIRKWIPGAMAEKGTETNPSRYVKVSFSRERGIKICYLQGSLKGLPKATEKHPKSDAETEKRPRRGSETAM